MIDFEKFTNYSQEILYASGVKMNEYKNTQIQPEHIMLAMIEDKGIIRDYLTELKLLNQEFINAIVSKVKSFPTVSEISNTQQIFLSNESEKLLTLAQEQAKEFKDEFIGIEQILLAMTKLDGLDIQQLLARHRVTSNNVLNIMKKIEVKKQWIIKMLMKI